MKSPRIERIREELSRIRDEVEALDLPDEVRPLIAQAVAGCLSTAIIALDHPDMDLDR